MSNLTILPLEFTWSETYEYFLYNESEKYKEPTVCEISFIITEGLQICGTSALEGVTLMEFLGKKSAKDLGLPEYLEPQPSAGSFPDKRSLACKALPREGLM